MAEWLANPWATFALGVAAGLAAPRVWRFMRGYREKPGDWP